LTKTMARKRSRLSPDERAERILDTVTDLLLRWGYARLTMADVAAKTGVGKGKLYLHWTTKEKLLQAVIDREIAQGTKDAQRLLGTDDWQLHAWARATFIALMGRPLAIAILVSDSEIFGDFSQTTLHTHGLQPTAISFMQRLWEVGALRQ